MIKRGFLVLVMGLLCFALTSPSLAAQVKKVEERFFPLTQEGFVSVENVAGNILIHSWDKEQVKMIATKSVGAVWEEQAEKLLDDIEIEIITKKSQLSINTRYPTSSWWKQITSLSSAPRIDYELWVPLNATVQIKSVSGDIQIKEKNNNIKVETVSGNIGLSDIWGNIEVSTISGDINIQSSEGNIMAKSVSGDIKIIETKGVVSSIDTTSGDIWVELEEIDSTSSGMNFSSISGDIDLFLPESIEADIDTQTVSGKINTDFKIVVQETLGKRGKVQGTIGGGGVRIKFKTISGDISLKLL